MTPFSVIETTRVDKLVTGDIAPTRCPICSAPRFSKGMACARGADGKPIYGGPNDPRRFSSRGDSRKAASAQIAKIPLPLAQHIARIYKP